VGARPGGGVIRAPVWLLVAALGCARSAAEVHGDVDALERQANALREETRQLAATKEQLAGELSELRANEVVLRALKDGKDVQYLLKVSIRQIHYSLNIKRQISDAVNEEEFEIATDKTTYDLAAPGKDLFDAFRLGSAVMHGSLGTWRLKIVSKRVVVGP
jgi:hypothetical protein